MSCDPKTYHGLTALMLAEIRRDLHQMGMHMGEEHVGMVKHEAFGVEVAYEFREHESSLHVRIVQKPFFVPCTMIYGRLDQAIARRQEGHDPIKDQ